MAIKVLKPPFRYSRAFCFIADSSGLLVLHMNRARMDKLVSVDDWELFHRTGESLCETMNKHWEGGAL